jgi:PEP-CTERM motif
LYSLRPNIGTFNAPAIKATKAGHSVKSSLIRAITVLSVCAISLAVASPAGAGVLTTTFADNNDYLGNFFNVTTGTNALTITGMTVNVDAAPMTIDVYIKSGTYVGSETNSAAWTLVTADPVTGLGEGNATPVDITPFLLTANSLFGFYVTIDSNIPFTSPFMYYTEGDNTYSNADLSLTAGEGAGPKFDVNGLNEHRIWNGSITYSVVGATAVPEPVTLSLFGAGLAGAIAMRRRKKKAA